LHECPPDIPSLYARFSLSSIIISTLAVRMLDIIPIFLPSTDYDLYLILRDTLIIRRILKRGWR